MATIETATGNIFTARVEALVNPVNCVGVMGKGLAPLSTTEVVLYVPR